MSSSNRGISLVESALVLAITAMLVSAVLVGSSLKHKAALQRIISDISSINSAVKSYKTLYSNALPGDDSTASARWSTTNGDGDGQMETGEILFFWRHLQLAGLITGSYDGATHTPGVGVMAGPSALGVTGYEALTSSSGINIQFSKFIGTTSGYAVLTPQEAWSIDNQFDNGKPGSGVGTGGSGNIFGGAGTGLSATACASSSTAYNLSTTSVACYLAFILSGV